MSINGGVGNEQLNYLNKSQKGDPFSNIYNQWSRNHPNFSYKNPPLNPIPQQMVRPSSFQVPSERTQPSSERVDEEKEKPYVPPTPYKPPIPFPQRFAKAKIEEQCRKFVELLKKLYINISFTEALSQMSSYAKFLKKILSNKRKLDDHETIALTKEYSALIRNKFPLELNDPESFSIACVIGDMSFERALCDLGANVSHMPLSVCKKLDVGELNPTNISLQLVDRSFKYPVGILEDVRIKVGQLFIMVDFMVLELEKDS
uniref:Uncharacterized protein LOC101514710 n=1 Tax=Cicer arietinum TaxID=3827 RepID=A0A1S2YJR7_CICAR|nr:uncharacterized protein LOC101514710 [Cicer arietinum]